MRREEFRWDTRAGREATARLDAYGDLRRHELAGGGGMTTSSGGGGRGRPGDLPSVFHASWDVETTLREWGAAPGGRTSRLLDHVWTLGREEVVVRVSFVFTNDPRELLESPPIVMTPEEIRMRGEPGRYLARVEETGKVFTYDWDLFEDQGVDAFTGAFCPVGRGAEEWWYARRRFLDRLHADFAAFLAERRGLGEFARLQAPRGLAL